MGKSPVILVFVVHLIFSIFANTVRAKGPGSYWLAAKYQQGNNKGN